MSITNLVVEQFKFNYDNHIRVHADYFQFVCSGNFWPPNLIVKEYSPKHFLQYLVHLLLVRHQKDLTSRFLTETWLKREEENCLIFPDTCSSDVIVYHELGVVF